ncbi:unnamed protein product [Cylindrotheca closterium]|uniref:Uncharacterized protein n=1 Tax=Cylindrotheca closterium TaxID=2856 RepID=A0AAD2FMH8_9STRA|nr:unnamed protein product [Cylindrotheca closterium]
MDPGNHCLFNRSHFWSRIPQQNQFLLAWYVALFPCNSCNEKINPSETSLHLLETVEYRFAYLDADAGGQSHLTGKNVVCRGFLSWWDIFQS